MKSATDYLWMSGVWAMLMSEGHVTTRVMMIWVLVLPHGTLVSSKPKLLQWVMSGSMVQQ